MLHTFLRYCSYTEQWRRPLRLQAHSPSVDQGHSIAMERQACPSISSAMVHCKGTKHCPYFTDWNDTFIFFFTPSPQSPFYFFLSYRCTISSHQRCISIDIYVSAYIYIQREREKLIKPISILLFATLCFTNIISLPKNVIKDLFFRLCIVCQLCSGTIFFFCFGVGVILVLTWVFLFQGGGGQTPPKLFFC